MCLALAFLLVGCEKSSEEPSSAPAEAPAVEEKIDGEAEEESDAEETEEEEEDDEDTPEAKEGPVKVIEFFDFGCGHCKKAAETVEMLKTQFGDDVVFEIKHFPLSPTTFVVAEASECAREQGKFQEYHDEAFDNFGRKAMSDLKEFATNVGLDEAAFTTCMDSGIKKEVVRADQKLGREMGVKGTPYFEIDGEIKIPGALPVGPFSKKLEEALAGRK